MEHLHIVLSIKLNKIKYDLKFIFFNKIDTKQHSAMGKSVNNESLRHEFKVLLGLLKFLPFQKILKPFFWSNIANFKKF